MELLHKKIKNFNKTINNHNKMITKKLIKRI